MNLLEMAETCGNTLAGVAREIAEAPPRRRLCAKSKNQARGYNPLTVRAGKPMTVQGDRPGSRLGPADLAWCPARLNFLVAQLENAGKWPQQNRGVRLRRLRLMTAPERDELNRAAKLAKLVNAAFLHRCVERRRGQVKPWAGARLAPCLTPSEARAARSHARSRLTE